MVDRKYEPTYEQVSVLSVHHSKKVFLFIHYVIHTDNPLQIFGPGPHNSFYVLRAVLFSWSIALAVHQFGFYDEIPKLKFW